MVAEPLQRRGRSSPEIFDWFTSRASFTSLMRLSSKSILSPGRTDKFLDGSSSSSSLYPSLSRRLRHNGSMKGGHTSPMFPTETKRKGCAFETSEPTSPKVTCIGQVRVKTKKHGKKIQIRTRSKRRRKLSFRRTRERYQAGGERVGRRPRTRQLWDSLSTTICEALKALSWELSCFHFQPCGSRSCCGALRVEREKREKATTVGCSAVLANWLAAFKEGEEEEIVNQRDLVEEQKRWEHMGSHTPVPAEATGSDDEAANGGECKGALLLCEDEIGEVSVPPKNALLLMRCRSEPVKMASYMSRFWESPPAMDTDERDDDDKKRRGQKEEDSRGELEAGENRETAKEVEEEKEVEEAHEQRENAEEENLNLWGRGVISANISDELDDHRTAVEDGGTLEVPEGNEAADERFSHLEQVLDIAEEMRVEGKGEKTETGTEMEEIEFVKNEHEGKPAGEGKNNSAVEFVENELQTVEQGSEDDADQAETRIEESQARNEEDEDFTVTALQIADDRAAKSVVPSVQQADSFTDESSSMATEAGEQEMVTKGAEREKGEPLPDCLLLMLCEPKLSMEVSRETWVCNTDFFQWRPKRSAKPCKNVECRRVSVDSDPGRSTAGYHAAGQPAPAPSLALGVPLNAPACGPLGLTRCKSDPLRSGSKTRKLQQHPVGVGPAEVGF